MRASTSLRCGFDVAPVDWNFGATAQWITGWIDAAEPIVDVRARIGRRLILGLLGAPVVAAVGAPQGHRRFTFRVAVQTGEDLLVLEYSTGSQWSACFRTSVSGSAPVQLGTVFSARDLARYVTGEATRDRGCATSAIEAVISGRLEVEPEAPFLGALETPISDGFVRDGKLLVSGWLVHREQPIKRVIAAIDGGIDCELYRGLQRRDVADTHPDISEAPHAHFVGLVPVRGAAPEPRAIMIKAELENGDVRVVFARRFRSWAMEALERKERHIAWAERVRLGIELWSAARRWGFGSLQAHWTALRAPWEMDTVEAAALAAPFAVSTPLSLYVASFTDLELEHSTGTSRGESVRGGDGLNLLFVLHCDFSWASALHVLALTREFSKRGHDCVVAVPERVDTLDQHDDPGCRGVLQSEVLRGVNFINGRGPDVIHGWTTRENVRETMDALHEASPDAVQLVHLEDNEHRVAAAETGLDAVQLEALTEVDITTRVGKTRSHPARARKLLERVNGVTVVIDRLKEFVPPGVPVFILTPAADARYFYQRPRLDNFRSLLRPSDDGSPTTVLCYHGNTHASNHAEVRELYAAVLELNRRGSATILIRLGRDDGDFLGDLAGPVSRYVRVLGRLERHRHVAEVLALADVFVQPGLDDDFNAYRFPSKLPEFFAIGRPVILPRTNVGLSVRHGIDAYVVERGDCAGIVSAVETIRADPDLARRLSEGSVAYAAKHFNWSSTADGLETFYRQLRGARQLGTHR